MRKTLDLCCMMGNHRRAALRGKEMFCTQCGRQLQEGASFCRSCGNRVKSPAANGRHPSSPGYGNRTTSTAGVPGQETEPTRQDVLIIAAMLTIALLMILIFALIL